MTKRSWIITGAVFVALIFITILGFSGEGDNSSNVKTICVNVSCDTDDSDQRVFRTISAHEFDKKIDSNESILIDMRTSDEHEQWRIAESDIIDFYDTDNLRNSLEKLDTTKTYLIYCNSGNRSEATLEMMKEIGFDKVYDLNGGIQAWAASGKNVIQ